MTPLIQLHQRPCAPVAAEIVQIARLLTEHWFTANVPEDIRRDLIFHDALCLYDDGQMRAFLVYTSLDGNLQITLMGTHPHCRGHGRMVHWNWLKSYCPGDCTAESCFKA